MSSMESKTTIQQAVSLVSYRRQLLADARKERAAMQRLVRRCEKALYEAEVNMSMVIVSAGVKEFDYAR